jgi:hypothetical protein
MTLCFPLLLIIGLRQAHNYLSRAGPDALPRYRVQYPQMPRIVAKTPAESRPVR